MVCFVGRAVQPDIRPAPGRTTPGRGGRVLVVESHPVGHVHVVDGDRLRHRIRR